VLHPESINCTKGPKYEPHLKIKIIIWCTLRVQHEASICPIQLLLASAFKSGSVGGELHDDERTADPLLIEIENEG
jgi:hypothetical protein